MQTWLRKLLTAGSLAAVPAWGAFPALGLAQDAGPRGGESTSIFKKLDADSNGKLTKDEIPDEQRRLFERLVETQDKNKDGELTEARMIDEGERDVERRSVKSRMQACSRGKASCERQSVRFLAVAAWSAPTGLACTAVTPRVRRVCGR